MHSLFAWYVCVCVCRCGCVCQTIVVVVFDWANCLARAANFVLLLLRGRQQFLSCMYALLIVVGGPARHGLAWLRLASGHYSFSRLKVLLHFGG